MNILPMPPMTDEEEGFLLKERNLIRYKMTKVEIEERYSIVLKPIPTNKPYEIWLGK